MIERIKTEIKRRMLEDYNGPDSEQNETAQGVCAGLLAFIDSLPAESPDFEAEWKRYTHTRKDDMRTNAVTMNVKEVAKHFAEWGMNHTDFRWPQTLLDAAEAVMNDVIKYRKEHG